MVSGPYSLVVLYLLVFTATPFALAHNFPSFGVWMHENPELQSPSSLHIFLGLLLGLHSVIMTNKVNANNNFKQEDDIFIWMMKGNKSM